MTKAANHSMGLQASACQVSAIEWELLIYHDFLNMSKISGPGGMVFAKKIVLTRHRIQSFGQCTTCPMMVLQWFFVQHAAENPDLSFKNTLDSVL